MRRISFTEFAAFVAQVAGVEPRQITPASEMERDLGVTGDDGIDLLVAIAQQYGTDFDRPHHGGRYLFHSEGIDLVGPVVRRLIGRSSSKVIPLTAGDLHLAVLRGRWEDPPWPAT